MADINAQISAQNDTLRNMLKVANQTDAITTDVQVELLKQRTVIQNNI